MPHLIDSGILIRMLGAPVPEGPRIRAAVRALLETHGELFTTAQNIAEFWNVSTRPASARGGFGRTVDQTGALLARCERALTVVTETDASYQIWRDLVYRHRVSGVQVHDARLVSIMLDRRLTHVLTLNPADFRRYPGISALTPEDALADSE